MQKSGRGIIIYSNNGKNELITIKRVKKIEDKIETYYTIPGGFLEESETYEEAIKREIKEELGIIVVPKELLLKKERESFKIIEEYFKCHYVEGVLGSGIGEEWTCDEEKYGKYEIVKIDINELSEYRLLPEEIKEIIIKKYSK